LHPDAAAAQPAGATLREAITSRRFICLYAACLACSFGVFVPFVHLSPYAADHGIAPSSAVLLVSAIGVGSTVGRFLLGGLADRLGHARTLIATYLVMALALVIWLASTTFWRLALFGFVFGSAYGGWVALLPPVVMDYFGARNISGVIGILYTSAGIGTLLGPSAAGFAYDLSHSYTLPILASIGGNLIAAALMTLVVHEPRRTGPA
jgi:MFS family permease